MSADALPPPEISLRGGLANAGQVVRVGQSVRRPASPQSSLVQSFLAHLATVGFSLSPQPQGWDEQGRERLTFLPGRVPHVPWPEWLWDDALLVSVGEAQKALHEAARSFRPPSGAADGPQWAESAGAYFPSSAFEGGRRTFCHNDLNPSNIVVDEDGTVAGIIDFDYVNAVDPLFDIAVAARHWAPLGDPLGSENSPTDTERLRRFTLFADVHELTAPDRDRVVALTLDFLVAAHDNVMALAAGGNHGFADLLANGYLEANHRSRAWVVEHRHQLAAGRTSGTQPN